MVLIVEDNLSVMWTYVEVFRSWGYSVLTAKDLNQAQELFKNYSGFLKLAILDGYLEGESTLLFAQMLKGLLPELPIFLVSGSLEDFQDPAYSDLFVVKLKKPIVWENLKTLVDQRLSS